MPQGLRRRCSGNQRQRRDLICCFDEVLSRRVGLREMRNGLLAFKETQEAAGLHSGSVPF